MTAQETTRVNGVLRDFIIGVTGHRPDRLPPNVDSWLPARFTDLYTNLQAIIPDHQFSLAVSLAEGTDQIAAQAAFALDIPFTAILPFDPAAFAADFESPDSSARLNELCTRARAVVTLPGQHATAEERDLAYLSAAEAIVARCQLLIAVWDGGETRGPGGTPAVIDLALNRGRPVVWIPADPVAPVTILVDREGQRRQITLDHLPEIAREAAGTIAADS